MQSSPPRESSSTPPFRDTRRPIKNPSIPLVPTAIQMLPNQNQPQPQSQGQPQQSSQTASMTSSQRSPPAQSASASSLPLPQKTSPQVTPSPNPPLGYPRPIPRSHPPQFLKSFHSPDEQWHMTPELLAEIERADLAQHLSGPPGTSGVAYAGGAGGYTAHVEPESPPKDPVIDKVRTNDRSSPKRPEHRRQSSSSSQKANSPNESERRDSPAFRTSPGDHSSPSYSQYSRDAYPSHRIPTPPLSRRTSNAPEALPLTSAPTTNKNSPPQSRPTPDRSLPVQEEAEEDHVISNRGPSPTPSSDILPEGRPQRQDSARGGRSSRSGFLNDESETLIDTSETLLGQDSDPQRLHNGDQDDEEERCTPRSLSIDLKEQARSPLTATQNGATRQTPLRSKARGGSTDQLGMRSIGPAIFEPFSHSKDFTQAPRYLPQPPQQQASAHRHDGYISEQNVNYGGQYPEDYENFLYDPYNHRSPRPNAPVPPTPHSQTAAPSPSPLISGSDSALKDPHPGSPYPYPFSHVRRMYNYAGTPNLTQSPSDYDPNHPAAIQEQLAMQFQAYARNNQAHLSDSTLSPSASPFPVVAYNPWAFVRTTGGRRIEHSMSLRSSPSHEPLSLPPPPPSHVRGRGSLKRRERSMNLRNQVRRTTVQPPARVESTQPRETSPEPSSGEETAGEDRYHAEEDSHWVNGVDVDDSADWIEEDPESDDEDLLELEYHPSFVSNVEKRRRRWETRWEALIQAVRLHSLRQMKIPDSL
jgi:hypothetical protein